jgi:hypothetical protein
MIFKLTYTDVEFITVDNKESSKVERDTNQPISLILGATCKPYSS